MAIRKRNTYLDLPSDNDNEDGHSGSELGYDSEERESRTSRARAPKRRKIATTNGAPPRLEEDQDEDDVDVDESASEAGAAGSLASGGFGDGAHGGQQLQHSSSHDDEAGEDDEIDDPMKSPRTAARKPASMSTSTSKTTTSAKSKLKTGIIYLPSLPPFLKPSALRSLLTPYTKHGISRLFLTPEATPSRKARVSRGGNRKVLYVDGWVEFASKRDAKTVVDACNGKIIGGKKGGYYRDDVWSMRYLSGFKWGDLVGERRDEDAARSSRLDAERRREKKEREGWLRAVEGAKVEETRQKREEERSKKIEGGADVAEGTIRDHEDRAVTERRGQRPQTFRQNQVMGKTGLERTGTMDGARGAKGNVKAGEDVQKILRQIF